MAGSRQMRLEALRAEAKRLNKRMMNKRYYQETAHGIDYEREENKKLINIKPYRTIKKYNVRQLERYNEQAREYLSRKTQHYGDREGRQIPTALVNKSFELQRKSRRQKLSVLKQVSHIPAMGPTAAFLQATTLGEQARKAATVSGGSGENPFKIKLRKPWNFQSTEALMAYVRNLEKRTAPGWRLRDINEKKQELAHMWTTRGDEASLAVAKEILHMDAGTFRVFSADRRVWDAAALLYDSYVRKNYKQYLTPRQLEEAQARNADNPNFDVDAMRYADFAPEETVNSLERNSYLETTNLIQWAKEHRKEYGEANKASRSAAERARRKLFQEKKRRRNQRRK